jgi:hypothetical protein
MAGSGKAEPLVSHSPALPRNVGRMGCLQAELTTSRVSATGQSNTEYLNVPLGCQFFSGTSETLEKLQC